MTAPNRPEPAGTTTASEPDYRPFTDSILTDIAVLPDEAQWELFGQIRTRYSPSLRVEWAALLIAAVIPLVVLAGWYRLHAHLPDVWCGVIAGVAAMFALDGLFVFAGSVARVVTAWRLRRADRRRARP